MIVKFTPNDICLDPPMNAITVEQTNYLHCPTPLNKTEKEIRFKEKQQEILRRK